MSLLDRGLDTTNEPAFVRERLALLAQTLFLVSGGAAVARAARAPDCASPPRRDH
jgi:hypothetical protein